MPRQLLKLGMRLLNTRPMKTSPILKALYPPSQTRTFSTINPKSTIEQTDQDSTNTRSHLPNLHQTQPLGFSHTVVFHKDILYLYEKLGNNTLVQMDLQETYSHRPSYKVLKYLSHLAARAEICQQSIVAQRTKSKQHIEELVLIKSLLDSLSNTISHTNLPQYEPGITSVYKGINELLTGNFLGVYFSKYDLINKDHCEYLAFLQLTRLNDIYLNWLNKKMLNPLTTQTLITSFSSSKNNSMEKQYFQWISSQYGNHEPEKSGHLICLGMSPENLAHTSVSTTLNFLTKSPSTLAAEEKRLDDLQADIRSDRLETIKEDVLGQFVPYILNKFSLFPQDSMTQSLTHQHSNQTSKYSFFDSPSKIKQLVDSSAFRQRVRDKLLKAEREGKKLLIISGETHYTVACREINLYLMSICRSEFNIKTLAMESDSPHHAFCHSNPDLNYKRYTYKARQEHWKMIPVDKYHHKRFGPISERDAGMLEWLPLKVDEHALFIVGAHHLYALNDSRLKEHFELVFVNTYNGAYPKTYPLSCHPEQEAEFAEMFATSKEHLWVRNGEEVLSLFLNAQGSENSLSNTENSEQNFRNF